jgi:hypothetical protein
MLHSASKPRNDRGDAQSAVPCYHGTRHQLEFRVAKMNAVDFFDAVAKC